jgi:hypothetical protein
MDGQLDAGAALAASGPNLSLYTGFDGTWLYLATQGVGATSGLDHFILTDLDPSGSRAAPWAKAGTVAGWDHFLGNEDGNNWCGWFDASEVVFNSSSAVKASGAYLEGALDLAALYGAVPDSLLIAVAAYASPNGGALSAQAPGGDGDGSVERPEYFVWRKPGAAVPDGPVASPGPLLHQSRPNPTRGGAVIRFSLPAPATVALAVYDVRGRLVRELARGQFAAGPHEVEWDGRDSHGRRSAAGVYFCGLAGDGWRRQRKMVVLSDD